MAAKAEGTIAFDHVRKTVTREYADDVRSCNEVHPHHDMHHPEGHPAEDVRPCAWCGQPFLPKPDALYCCAEHLYDAKKYRRAMRRETERSDGPGAVS